MKDSRLLIRISILFCFVMSISSCNVNDTSSLIDESVISSETCEHSYRKEIVKKATIIEDGLYKNICEKCGYEEDAEHKYYDLDELVFEDQIFMYDGNPHELTIKGLLPLSVNVIYKNNSLKEIGSKEAIAEFYDENNNLIETKKANIKVVENTGLENIYIDTNNVAITSKETYVDMTLSIDNCDSKYIKNNVSGQIRWRGNGTLTYDKKAYRLKFDEKQDMLGLNDGIKARSWVLLADYNDQSMLRNTGAFFIGNSLFNYSNNYCTSYKHVNVYLNDSYNGVYLLAEQQQANKNRVNINEPEEDYKDTDIGYLLELDAYANQDPYNFTVGDSSTQRIGNVNLSRKSYSIKSNIYSNNQVTFIRDYLRNIHTIFYRAATNNGLYILDENNNLIASPYDDVYQTISHVVDIEAMFKTYLLHEFIKSVDVGYSSFYMFVDFSSESLYPKLTFGAPWDFDWSSGNCNDTTYSTPTGAYNSTSFQKMNPWLYMFSKMDFFDDLFAKYYAVFNHSKIFEGLISQANYISDAFVDDFANNYEKWKTLGTIIPAFTPNDVKSFKVHKDAVNHLINWYNNRKTYLDSTYL